MVEGKVNTGVDTDRIFATAPYMRKRSTAELSNQSNEGGAVPRRLWPIARELAEGLENDEIAERCVLAKHTVADYVHQLKVYLAEPNRGRLILRCREMVQRGEIEDRGT